MRYYFTTIATIIIVCNSLNNNPVKQINLPVLEYILPDVISNYAILIGDNGSLGRSVPLVRFSFTNMQENIAKLPSKPSIYIFDFIDPDRLHHTLEVIVKSKNFKPAQFLLLCDSNIPQLVDVLWKFKWVCVTPCKLFTVCLYFLDYLIQSWYLFLTVYYTPFSYTSAVLKVLPSTLMVQNL